MDPTPTAALKTLERKPTTINGTLKKHHRPPAPPSLYKECLKNHVASLGGHALDGCGEFMPSSSDPSSLLCAACGCHRNFHRRLQFPHFNPNSEENSNADASSENAAELECELKRQRQQYSSSPPPPSAPHMLLALSTGGMSAGPTSSSGPLLPRKRFRTKFSPVQKDRMLELSERLGWSLQKRDEGIVEERCREIGVGKGVFKVWMHNNKHHFRKSTDGGGGENNGQSGVGIHGSASCSS